VHFRPLRAALSAPFSVLSLRLVAAPRKWFPTLRLVEGLYKAFKGYAKPLTSLWPLRAL